MKTLLPLTIALTLTPLTFAMPPVFTDLTFEDAKTKAAAQDKLLIVDGTAEWCGPCKQMDKTTWVDPNVVEWIEANAIAIQVDVDHQRETARELKINAMPTIIAFRGEDELNRFVGYRDANATLRWLNRIAAGEQLDDIGIQDHLGVTTDLEDEVDSRMQSASDAWFEDRYDDGLADLVWLWEEAPRDHPEWRSDRGMMLSDILWEYASAHEPSRARIESWRDQATLRLQEKDGNYADLDDWLSLSYALDLESEIIDWIIRIADRKDSEKAFERLSVIGYETHELLIEFELWEVAGQMIRQPATAIQMALFSAGSNREMLMSMMGEEDQDLFDDEFFDFSLTEDLYAAVEIWAALHVANRPESDAALETLLRDSHAAQMRVLLVEVALQADVVSLECLDWLDEAEHEGEDVDALRRRTLRRLQVMGIDVADRAPAPPLPKLMEKVESPGY